MSKPVIHLLPINRGDFAKALVDAKAELTLRDFLAGHPAFSTRGAITDAHLDTPVSQLDIRPAMLKKPDAPLYWPHGMVVQLDHSTEAASAQGPVAEPPPSGQPTEDIRPPAVSTDYATAITPAQATHWAYAEEIETAASFLRANLSVLVVCDKLVVEHLYGPIVRQAGLTADVLRLPKPDEGGGIMQRSLRQLQLAKLKELITDLKKGSVLVLPHLDLLAGGSDSNLPTESRELIELAYAHGDSSDTPTQQNDRLILAFTDRSMELPEVLAARFAVRLLVSGVSRIVTYQNGEERPLGQALVTADEAAMFQDYKPDDLYKNVAGMNPVRLRQAIQYAVRENKDKAPVPVDQLYVALRAFKAQTSAKFEVPNITFDQIGGYHEVKVELQRALDLMQGGFKLPDEELRRDLIPRGFIFYGPPGTGKTLFAKAVANMLKATIQVVSGPEVTDMYVGESERKVRELFAEARRNAPAVLVFDEFDAIATERTGGRQDGGARAGNAIVAQILTEMDGFRPDVPMLVIGTTNRIDIIDKALLRPSRFKPIAIGHPDLEARQAIARIHAERFRIKFAEEGQDYTEDMLKAVAHYTDGFSGDHIQSLFRDACVAEHCQGIAPSPERFGVLIGSLRKGTEQQELAQSEHEHSPLERTPPNTRPRAVAPLVRRTPGPQTAPETPPPDGALPDLESGPEFRQPQRLNTESESNS